jgi:septum formation protein
MAAMAESGVVTRPRLVLASASPRRLELLLQVGVTPVVVPADLDETPKPDEEARLLVERLAIEKAATVADGKDLTIGADTVVVVDGDPLGKPSSVDDARAMLARLSGRRHQVMTGVAVVCNGHSRSSVEIAEVDVRVLSAEDIDWYLATGEWAGKAGAYAIQGAFGLLVERIEGNYQAIVGLPLHTLDLLLDGYGRPLRTWSTASVGPL